jgi:hypothetical protein
MKFKVELEIDDEKKCVTIKDSKDSIKKEFSGGVHLVAADGENKVYYLLSVGSSADLGWALAQGFNDGWKNKFIRQLFGHFTQWINKFMVNAGDGYELSSLESVANRWEEEDQSKWATMDSEDVLIDKQKSEAKKKLMFN